MSTMHYKLIFYNSLEKKSSSYVAHCRYRITCLWSVNDYSFFIFKPLTSSMYWLKLFFWLDFMVYAKYLLTWCNKNDENAIYISALPVFSTSLLRNLIIFRNDAKLIMNWVFSSNSCKNLRKLSGTPLHSVLTNSSRSR